MINSDICYLKAYMVCVARNGTSLFIAIMPTSCTVSHVERQLNVSEPHIRYRCEFVTLFLFQALPREVKHTRSS